MATAADIAWAAGLFEGEGCITVLHSRTKGRVYPQPRLKLNSTDEDVVRRFHAIVEVGSVRQENSFAKRGWKVQWEWYVSNKEAVMKTLDLLLPYLGERRRLRAAEALGVYKD